MWGVRGPQFHKGKRAGDGRFPSLPHTAIARALCGLAQEENACLDKRQRTLSLPQLWFDPTSANDDGAVGGLSTAS